MNEGLLSFVDDFLSSDHFLVISGPVKEYAAGVLTHACEYLGERPSLSSIEKGMMQAAYLDIPAEAKKEIPSLLESFFLFLADTGRVPGASSWASDTVLAGVSFTASVREDGSVKGKTFRKNYTDVGRNDKCPCGSGKKFKKCCMGLLQ
ncbi:MAG: SEC-C metal-binding domain-containing protein [Fibrobacterota bacterium]